MGTRLRAGRCGVTIVTAYRLLMYGTPACLLGSALLALALRVWRESETDLGDW